VSNTWRKARVGLLAVAAGALFLFSIDVRTDWFEPTEETVGFEDARTGAILIDLDDDVSSSDRDRIHALLRRAIAPASWPRGAAALGDTVLESAQLYRIEPPASEISDVLQLLADDGDVEAVEVERYWSLPVHEAAAFAFDADAAPARDEPTRAFDGPDTFQPNDPYYKHQWHLDQIQMPRAWTRSRGADVVVAVIDTGVSFEDHASGSQRWVRAPDLADTKMVPGWDFVDGDDHPNDEHGHGTHVAGTIAQSTNNALGVAGVAPEAAIMPLRVLDRSGRGSFGNVAAAIRWAADHDADIINMSLGGGMPSQAVRRAIDYAHGKGVLVIAAAGNSGRARVEYPAMHGHVVSVGAVRFDETLTFYSCYGKGLDLVAPGGDIRVDQNGDGLPDGVIQNTLVPGTTDRHDYIGYMGTSMASPHVAGVAALIHASGVRDPDTIEGILIRSAKDKKDRRRYAAGLVQADDALALAAGGLGNARGGLAAGLGLLLLFGLRRRNALNVGMWPVLGVAVVVAGGLAFVPWHWVPGLGGAAAFFARGVPTVLADAGGAYFAPLLLTALVPVALASVLLSVRRAAPVVVGTCIAFAAWLGLEAVIPTAEIALLPAWAAGPWLLANAAVACVIARLAATRPL
jgi:serine protease